MPPVRSLPLAVSESISAGTLWHEGREIGYSTRHTIALEPTDQRIDIFFHRDAPYKPGSYRVELYADGFRIGDGQFDVK